MELRVLRYFLEAAREENITRAARKLHVSQPTMSKQLKDLENELGQQLFVRTNYAIKLTDAGLFLKKRAEEILNLSDRTERAFRSLDTIDGGEIHIGSAETEVFSYLSCAFHKLQLTYPHIRLHVTSGNLSDLTESLDTGIFDFALVSDFINTDKYNFLDLPMVHHWGIILRTDDSLAQKPYFTIDDLRSLPLICSRQGLSQLMASWFGHDTDQLRVVATYNLIFNAAIMVRSHVSYAITFDNLIPNIPGYDLCFRPLYPLKQSTLKVIWKKYQQFTPQAAALLTELRHTLTPENIHSNSTSLNNIHSKKTITKDFTDI